MFLIAMAMRPGLRSVERESLPARATTDHSKLLSVSRSGMLAAHVACRNSAVALSTASVKDRYAKIILSISGTNRRKTASVWHVSAPDLRPSGVRQPAVSGQADEYAAFKILSLLHNISGHFRQVPFLYPEGIALLGHLPLIFWAAGLGLSAYQSGHICVRLSDRCLNSRIACTIRATIPAKPIDAAISTEDYADEQVSIVCLYVPYREGAQGFTCPQPI